MTRIGSVANSLSGHPLSVTTMRQKQQRGGRSLNHRVSGLVQRDVDDISSSKQIIGLTNNLATEANALNIDADICESRVAMSDKSVAASPSRGSPRLLDCERAQLRFKHYSIRTEQPYVEWIRRLE